MKVAVFAYSRRGCQTARMVMECFAGCEIRAFTMARYEETGFDPLEKPSKSFYGPIFQWSDAMVFVGSVGIAVREIAPHIKSKLTDPAVIAVDELAGFVIPLLAGHIGGGNALALKLAACLGATPVITTATDINKKFSVDAWAVQHGLFITSLSAAKSVSAEILEHSVPLTSDFPIVTALPNGTVEGECGKIGICISCFRKKPFEVTLLLVPPILHVGIGCRRGTTADDIQRAVESVLAENQIHRKAIKQIASIDLKADEDGLRSFCEEQRLPVIFYTADQLRAVPGNFTPSDRVLRVTGVDNVCERAALAGAERLYVKKIVYNGVTVAIAAEPWEVRFD